MESPHPVQQPRLPRRLLIWGYITGESMGETQQSTSHGKTAGRREWKKDLILIIMA